MGGILRFVTKIGILGGAIYYTRQIGVWDDSTKTYRIAQEIITYSKPYLKPVLIKVESQFPIVHPIVQELSTISDLNRSVATYWNKGIIKSVDFIANAPCALMKSIGNGTSFIINELQQAYSTSSASPTSDKKSPDS